MNKAWIWPAGIIGTIAAFISFMAFTWIYYDSQQIDLVTPNYYERQIQYQGQIDRIRRTKDLPEPMRLSYSAEQRLIEIRFPSFFKPEEVKGAITLYRPSDASLDFFVPLALNPEGKQFISTTNLAAGMWRAKIDWEFAGLGYYHEEVVFF